jgi:hypothetical protein
MTDVWVKEGLGDKGNDLVALAAPRRGLLRERGKHREAERAKETLPRRHERFGIGRRDGRIGRAGAENKSMVRFNTQRGRRRNVFFIQLNMRLNAICTA